MRPRGDVDTKTGVMSPIWGDVTSGQYHWYNVKSLVREPIAVCAAGRVKRTGAVRMSWVCGGVGEWVWFVGHGDQGGGDVLEGGFDVGGGGWAGGVGVAGVGAGDAVAEVAFDPGQGRMAQPVGRHSLGSDPGKLAAKAVPEKVVASVGERSSVAVAQQGIGGQDRAAAGGGR